MNDPSTSYKASTSYAPPPSYVPTHRRSAHSIAYSSTVPSSPVNAPYVSPILSGKGSLSSAPSLPRRKGLVGKGKLPAHTVEANDASSEFRITGVSDLKRKHNAKAQSLSTIAVDIAPKVGGSFLRTTLPKLDTAPSLPSPRNSRKCFYCPCIESHLIPALQQLSCRHPHLAIVPLPHYLEQILHLLFHQHILMHENNPSTNHNLKYTMYILKLAPPHIPYPSTQ